MGLERRLAALEAQTTPPEDRESREIICRLTWEELTWLSEPSKEAQSRVPCPHVELISCGCRGAEREQRGFVSHPELLEKYQERWRTLEERTGEILQRGPVLPQRGGGR